MKTKDRILQAAGKRGVIRTADIVRVTGIARQTIAQHLKELVEQGKLLKSGSTQSASYRPLSSRRRVLSKAARFIAERKLANLHEDQAFKECSHCLSLKAAVSRKVFGIASYAFTEMLNNAIEHSKSCRVKIAAGISKGRFEFEIRDWGIGVYEKIKRKFHLPDHTIAAGHLLKGKQTTDPKNHSGQGIFFTSKIADLFVLKSASLELRIDNGETQDIFLLKIPRPLKGTSVFFSIKTQARRDMKALFDEYSNADYEFDKTKIMVRLSSQTGGYVSRSEARRLLFGLGPFKRVVFDFQKVRGIGQGFADEIFRVYAGAHPEKKLEAIHSSREVDFMIRRCKS